MVGVDLLDYPGVFRGVDKLVEEFLEFEHVGAFEDAFAEGGHVQVSSLAHQEGIEVLVYG